MMRALVAVGLLALLVVPTTSAQDPEIEAVVYDLFVQVTPADMVFEPGCGGGRFETLPSGTGFRFFEGAESGDDTADTSFGGFASTGCGRAIYNAVIPAGLDHYHVRFNASRSVENFEVSSGTNPVQEIQVLNMQGGEVLSNQYFAPTDPSRTSEFIDPSPSFRTPGLTEAQFVWYFDDPGIGGGLPVPDALSGTAFEATVHSIEIEYSSVPAVASSIQSAKARASGSLVEKQSITATIDQATFDEFGVSVRVQTEAGFAFESVTLPDGRVLTEGATRFASGAHGYDPFKVMVETFGDPEVSWFTVPYAIVESAGPGDYVFVLTTSTGLEVQPQLWPVAVIIGILPLVASVFAVTSTRRFAREAFGGFRRAANALMISTAVLFLFYVAVMVGAGLRGQTTRLITTPFDAGTYFLYIQMVLAAVGFALIYLVGRELYRITVPKE